MTTLKNKPTFFLSNESKDGNPIITSIVQTPRQIDYKDTGGAKYNYKPSAIENAIKGLIGYQIEDEQHRGTGDKSFATIIDGGYCPDYGGYVKSEVFKPEYHDLMKNIAKNMENGIFPKKGFSTEVKVKDLIEVDENEYDIIDMDYDGLIWTKNPRDPDTGICSVKLNKKTLPTPQRSEKMTDVKKIPLADYEALETKYKKLEEDYTNGESAYTKLAKEYKTGKELYTQAQTEIEDLTGQLKPIWEQEEQERVDILNKIVENAKEEEQDGLRKSLENQSKETLTVLHNAMTPNDKGAVVKPRTPPKDDEEEFTAEEVRRMMGRIK